jgi:hypothetical protein
LENIHAALEIAFEFLPPPNSPFAVM